MNPLEFYQMITGLTPFTHDASYSYEFTQWLLTENDRQGSEVNELQKRLSTVGDLIRKQYLSIIPRATLDIGEGWYGIIIELFNSISDILSHGTTKIPGSVSIITVKEKFGGLRVYTSGVCPDIDRLITRAEEQADETCERCGEPGILQTTGSWLKTLCTNCAKNLGYHPYEERPSEEEGKDLLEEEPPK